MSSVRIIHGGLEEDPLTKEITIRGVVDQSTLKYINMAWYQREQGFSKGHINKIITGIVANSHLADIVIGMRGERVQTKDDTYILQDKCYCVDGGQRLYAVAMATNDNPGLKVSLGAKVHLGTTEEKENEMFCVSGTTQKRISPSVLMRNKKKKVPAINSLLLLNKDEAFALRGRIAWGQVKNRGELMSGFTLARVTGALHAHQGGALRSAEVDSLVNGIDRLHGIIGEEYLRQNMVRFFDAVDACWNIRNLSGSRDEISPQLKQEFLMTLAQLMSRYSEFWDGSPRHEFYCGEKYIKRLKGFKVAAYMRTGQTKLPKDGLLEVLRQRLHLAPVFDDAVSGEAAQ
jgi:hypothetical protein